MAMRLSGLMSGMDTESIISQLVEARKTKVDKTKKAQTKLQWKQDAWKDLNTKLKNLQSKYLSSMRFTSAYSKKVTKVSDPNAVSVITGEDAVNGVQSLKIDKLAKTGYLTGGSIEKEDGTRFNAMSKLSDLGVTGSGKININTGSTSVDIQVDGNTTISDVLTQLKNAGLNANFDENNQRFFISSKESGAKSDFSLTALDQGGLDALKALGVQESFEADPDKKGAVQKEYEKYAGYYVVGDRDATLANMSSLIAKDVQSKTDSYLAKYKSLVESREADQKTIDKLEAQYKGADGSSTLKSKKEYEDALKAKNEEIEAKEKALKEESDPDQKRKLEKELVDLKKEADELTTQKNDRETLDSKKAAVAQADKDIANIESYVNITETEKDGQKVYSAEAKDKLKEEVADRFYQKAEFADSVVKNPSMISGNATKVNGQDAEIELNGAKFTSKDNTFKINGLTFTALNETNGNQVTVTTQQDTDGIYDMVKNFLKEYNAIINEMDKLYNADSAKGYEPLTSEEKEALSDSEVEEYEKKIKNALLRRDENLSSVSSTLRAAMSGGIEIGGKTMYLHDFGIENLGYFEAPDNEKNAYHIFGDPDDPDTAGKSDVLKGMIANDPDTVISFFTKLSQNMYDEMTNMSKSVNGYRSFGSFYDDKKMKSDYDNYTVKIKEQEKKLNEYEDKWYKKFAAMETALSKMQNSANAVTSLLGGS
ncbi:MAG: flagellar filament capping protein FliD [bacterium]|nr:flagellar filament capping protein FliD [bacterium]MCM1376082.1 flagellar filament capping protein FliD [Muribaculum sp.]